MIDTQNRSPVINADTSEFSGVELGIRPPTPVDRRAVAALPGVLLRTRRDHDRARPWRRFCRLSAHSGALLSVVPRTRRQGRLTAHCRIERVIVEHLWSRAGANGGNGSQGDRRRDRLQQANPQPSAACGNGPGLDGKEGVDGSSPSEGSAKATLTGSEREAVIDEFGAQIVVAGFVAVDPEQPVDRRCGRPWRRRPRGPPRSGCGRAGPTRPR